MEGLIIMIVLGVGWAIFRMFLSAGIRTVTSGGSLAANLDLQFNGMAPLALRLKDARLSAEPDSPEMKDLEVKGLFPLSKSMDLKFITSVFDDSSGTFEPVLSHLEQFQEAETAAYQHSVDVGRASPDQGFIEWVKIGVVIPMLLVPPYSGRRNMHAVVRLVDKGELPNISLGRHSKGDKILWQQSVAFELEYQESGYLEAAESRDMARALSVQLAVAIAMSDGDLDEAEGNAIKHWIAKTIRPYGGETQGRLKELYNSAFRDAYYEAESNSLSLSDLTRRLAELGDEATKYEAVELCLDVMAADGIAKPSELKTIRRIADALSLDLDEIERMRDQRIVSVKTEVATETALEDLLGIESSWSEDKIRKHLRDEFQKWNNRMNALPEGEERQNAQRMLDLIANARKKYA